MRGKEKMDKVYFCSTCKKIFTRGNSCTCQEENDIKEIKVGTPVNIIGTKLKGKVYRIKNETLEVLITSTKNRTIKTYPLQEVRKVL